MVVARLARGVFLTSWTRLNRERPTCVDVQSTLTKVKEDRIRSIRTRSDMEATTAVMWLTLIAIATPTSDNVTDAGWLIEV